MWTQIQTLKTICGENVLEHCTVGTFGKLRTLIHKPSISVSRKTLLLFILKFNVNVTIPIPNIEECGLCLMKTSDWSDHEILTSDWLIDMLNASRLDQKSFLTGTMLQKENSNANSTQSILGVLWLYKDCNIDKK